MLDAYSLRKIAPRILIGVIGINLSIYLCVAAIDVTNVIGSGIGDLLREPFIEANSYNKVPGIEANAENTIVGVVGSGAIVAIVYAIFATGGAALVAILGLLLPLLIAVLLVAIAVLITIVIRYGLLIVLTVLSPVAIACFILPGTEKYFRQWWDLFIKTLLVYPIIAVIFAISDIMAAIFLTDAQKQGDGIALVFLFVAILAVVGPLFMIPFAFQFAGGILGQAMKLSHARARSLSGAAGEAIRKNRQDPNTWLGSRAQSTRQWRERKGYTPGQVVSGTLGGAKERLRGGKFREGYRSKTKAISSPHAWQESSEFMEKNGAFNAFKNNDDALWAFRTAKDETHARQILAKRWNADVNDEGVMNTAALVMRARNQVDGEAGALAAVRAQASTGTGYENFHQMANDIVEATDGDMGLAMRAYGEMRGNLTQGGQGHLGGGSFMVGANAIQNIANARASGDAGAIARANAAADETVTESVIMSPGAAQAAAYGKGSAAQAIAKGHRDRITKLLNSMNNGQVTEVGGEKRVANERDIKQAFAVANGFHDILRSAGGENAIAGADLLLGSGVPVESLKAEVRAALGPAWEKQRESSKTGGPEGGLTIRDIMRGYHGHDQAYDEIRQDFMNQREAANAQLQGYRPPQPDAPNAPQGPPNTQ